MTADQPTTPPEGVCGKCRQVRPLFLFAWVPRGWMEFKEVGLCARDYSQAELAYENDEPMPWADLFVSGTDEEIAAALSGGAR